MFTSVLFEYSSSSNKIYCATGAPTTMTRKSHSFLRYKHTYNYYELSFISVLATYYSLLHENSFLHTVG
jgi:hypothetical protein